MKIIKKIGILLLSIFVQTIFLIPRFVMLLLKLVEFLLRITRTTIEFAIKETEKEITELNGGT